MSINKVKLSLKLLTAGYCKHAELVTIRGGSMRQAIYPAGFAYMRHPVHGVVLWDTGYARRFYEHTTSLPYSIYARVTPVFFKDEESAVNQLANHGIKAEEVNYIIISHFHADHIAGLRDFPKATFICSKQGYNAVRNLAGLAAVRRGYIPSLLPDDFEARSVMLDDEYSIALPEDFPYRTGIDVFGDGSMICVDISGHATGQWGMFVETEQYPYFLCADAVWSSQAYRENRPPHPIAGLIMPNRKQYEDSFERIVRLHQLQPQLRIIPSHCREVWERWIQGDEML